jgi:1-deoxy-D-xylulose-5-phosphate synthase
MAALPLGRAEIRRPGQRVGLLAFGCMLAPALEAGERLDATVVNMRFVKPLDEDMVRQLAARHELLVTLEDNVVAGGAGSAVNDCLAARQILVPVVNLGLPDRFLEHGTREQLLAECGLDRPGILRAISERMGQGVVTGRARAI